MQFNRLTKLKCLFLALAMFCLSFTGCVLSPAASPVSATGFYFDTVISVTVYDPSQEPLLEECMGLAEYYENLLSPNKEGSDIWEINHSQGAYVTVDEDTLSLLSAALSYAQLSEGLADPAIGALSGLWNFGSGNQEILPAASQIKEAISHVDYQAIVIKGNQVKLTDVLTQIDLGFIAKGFIGDKIKEFLLSEGVSSALINLGGNVVALGNKPDGTPYRVGIRDPFGSPGSVLLTLEVSGESVVSSGNYERFFEKDGKRYHHILSPETGYPAESGLAQATIISPASVDGDALSTLCFLLGYEKAASLLENYPDIRAIFVAEDGNVSYVNFH